MAEEPTGAELDLVYIPDHVARTVKSMLSQDHTKPRIVSLASAMGDAVQTMEDISFDLLMSRLLESATGAQLDQLGAIVGEQRGALDDQDYRRFIRARVLVNICKGTVDELLVIFGIVTAPSEVRYVTMYPAGFQLQAIRPTPLELLIRRRIRRMLADAKPAGVTMVLIEALVGFFGFADNPGAEGYDVGKLARLL